MARDEAVIFGLRAALAVAARRPHAIRRAFHDKKRRRDVAPLLQATAAERRPYREVDDAELARITGTVHHEGVAVVCDPLPLLTPETLLAGLPDDGVCLALDGVDNPHNHGAILRSAAWFGIGGVLLGTPADTLNPAAIRVAQGGAEVTPIAAAADLPRALTRYRDRGLAIVGADHNAQTALFDRPLPRPLCLVLGNEATGLSPAVRKLCTATVRIPGAAGVESLNVSVSAGILLAAAMSRAARG
ncbi:MAG: RNA methyltransferase [Myxococcales bacterium]|nr:RNA methyltransferase [Myxococcales bacterium]